MEFVWQYTVVEGILLVTGAIVIWIQRHDAGLSDDLKHTYYALISVLLMIILGLAAYSLGEGFAFPLLAVAGISSLYAFFKKLPYPAFNPILAKSYAVVWYAGFLLHALHRLISPAETGVLLFADWLALMVMALLTYLLNRKWQVTVKEHPVFFVMGVYYFLIVFGSLNTTAGGQAAITMFWAAYSIGMLIRGVYMRNKPLSNASLVLIVLIVTKFIVIDIRQAEMIWKIGVSMAFGIALLLLSYQIQPLLSEESEEEK